MFSGMLEGVSYWKSKAYAAILAGFKGQLGNSLLTIVRHDFSDAAKKAYRKHNVTESQKDASRVADEENATPFLDTIPSPESMPEEPIDLKSLGLNVDELSPTELRVVKDVIQGLNEGYSFDSKQGSSFRVRWGKDYGKNIRAFSRAKKKLKKP